MSKQPIPLTKQSKRAQKEYHARQRGSWHGVDPVTKVISNKKLYDRKRANKEYRQTRDENE